MHEEIIAIEQSLDDVNPDSEPNLAHRIFERLRQRLPALQNRDIRESIEMTSEGLDRILENLMQPRLTFFKHRFFFLAVVPDELTAFEELRKLLDEAKR